MHEGVGAVKEDIMKTGTSYATIWYQTRYASPLHRTGIATT